MSTAWSMIETPIAPDCDRKATEPGRGLLGAIVASMRTSAWAFITPMQLGPTRRMPFGPAVVAQLALARGAGRPDLAEAGRDDAERLHALLAAGAAPRPGRAGRARRSPPRSMVVGDRRDVGVALDGVDRRGLRVHREHRPAEPALDDVLQDLVPDRSRRLRLAPTTAMVRGLKTASRSEAGSRWAVVIESPSSGMHVVPVPERPAQGPPVRGVKHRLGNPALARKGAAGCWVLPPGRPDEPKEWRGRSGIGGSTVGPTAAACAEQGETPR